MPNESPLCLGLEPSIDENCTHIILGSMPGVVSLREQQYYAHPQNRFWRLMAHLLEGTAPPDEYAARLSMLLRHRIALWDSIDSCEREGSLDSAIRNVRANDFSDLLERYPRLHTFCLNGGKSAAIFRRANRELIARRDLTFHALPSTSAANARWNFAKLAEAWKKALPLEK